MNVLDEIVELIRSQFAWSLNGTRPNSGTRLREDLDLDSLHLVQLQVALEERFHVVFDAGDEQLLDAFITVGSLATYVQQLINRV